MAELLSGYVEITGMIGTAVCSFILLAAALLLAWVGWEAFTEKLSDMAYRKEARAYYASLREFRDSAKSARPHQGDR